MLCYTMDESQKRTLALLEAVKLCGGEEVLSALLKISRTTLNKWINNPRRKISYNKAILIEKHTGISVERLLPHEKEVEEYLKAKYALNNLFFRKVAKNKIVIKGSVSLPYDERERPIIIDTKGVLISGLEKYHAYQEKDIIKVVVLDLELLLLERRPLLAPELRFTLIERIAIGLRLKQLLQELIGDRQGKRNNLRKAEENPLKNMSNPSQLCPSWDQVSGRTDEIIAGMVGFKSKSTFHRAQQVYSLGIPKLIEALSAQQISIGSAAKIAKVSKDQQLLDLQLKLKGATPC